MGNCRFYLCEPGIISPEELPPKWALLHAVNGKAKRKVFPQRMGYFSGDDDFHQQCYMEGERGLVVSAAMRLGNRHTNIAHKVLWKQCYQFDPAIPATLPLDRTSQADSIG